MSLANMRHQKLNLLLILVICVLGIWAAHTPRPTKEPNEGEGLSFVYNGHSHHLIIRTKSGKDTECYVITLSDAERMDVHTDTGMRTIELKYLAMLVAAQPATFDTLSTFDQKACGHAQRNGTLSVYVM